jgi:group I intron endonuclease
MTGTVYLITNDVTNGKYVGITTQKLSRRWNHHISHMDVHDYPLYRAMCKYGVKNFRIKPLEEVHGDTKQSLVENLNEMEMKYVAQHQSFVGWNCGGYNLTIGGGMKNISVESRKKQGRSMRIVYKNNPSLAKQHAEKLHRRYDADPSYGKNIADKLRALYVNNPSMRTKIGDVTRGNKHPSFDDEVYTFRNLESGEVFNGSRYDFYNKYNLSKSKVCLLLQGKRKTHKNWVLNTNTQKENTHEKYHRLCEKIA